MRWRYVQTGILLLFCFVLGFNIIIPLFDRRSFAEAKIGDISDAVVDSWEFDQQEGRYPALTRLGSSEYYAIVCTGDTGLENDGFIRTIKVWNSNGTIKKSLIDSLEYDITDGLLPSICHISGDMYVITYSDDTANKQSMVTVIIDDADGLIANAVTDVQQCTYDGGSAMFRLSSDIIHVTGNVFAVVYTDLTSGDLFLETWNISTAGIFNDVQLDIQEIDTSDGNSPSMCLLDADTVAIVYQAGVAGVYDGYMSTWNISSLGLITNTRADFWEFDTVNGYYPDISKIEGTTYVIGYNVPIASPASNKVYAKTCTISDNGDITSSWLGSLTLDAVGVSAAGNSFVSFFNVSGFRYHNNSYIKGATYSGEGSDGYVQTFSVKVDGTIATIDTFEITPADTISWKQPVVYISDGASVSYFLLATEDTNSDGWVKTFSTNIETWQGSQGYFTFKNTDYTPVYDNMTQGWFSFENTSSWQGSDGFFTFDNTPTWKGSDGYFTFGNVPSWQGTDGYFTFDNTPTWQGSQGYFTFGNLTAWKGLDGYFTFGNITTYETIIDGYFNFANTPAWQGVSGYYTFGNTPSWSGVDGYFTFGNLSTNHTIDEGYFAFNNGEWKNVTNGYFTFTANLAWTNTSEGYFTFGNSVNYMNISQGYFNFSNTPSWHGTDKWFSFANNVVYNNIDQGWFSFENITAWQNITQGYFNFSNNVSWQNITQGNFTFGNGAWQPIEQGYFTFTNISTWQTLTQGYFTFGNTSYMIIVSTFPADGDIICPTCYENDTFFYFNAHVDHFNGTLMNITWKTWNGTLLGQVNNVGNGTWHIVPFETIMPIIYGSAYNYTINVTDGATFIEKVITFSTDTYTNCMMSTLSPEQFSAIIMLALFMFLFWVGYMGEKRSAGAFMLISGLVLIGEALVAWAYLPMSFGLLLVALGIFISLLGINKWLIKPNIPQKGEAQKPQ